MTSLRALSWTFTAAALAAVAALTLVATGEPLRALGLQLDLVSAVLLVLVLGVGAVVAAFSRRHVFGEPRLGAFTAALGATVLGLSIAVTAVYLPVLWLAWATATAGLVALVGWRHQASGRRPMRYVAGWLVVGDLLLLVALIALMVVTGTTDRTELADAVPQVGGLAITAIALLVAASGVVRSALLPAHRWLPETAAAPTPVSALLHAGIVNGAGVLAVLLWPVLAAAPIVLVMLALLGGASILVASAIASVRPDVKGRLAASTSAQMGFMTVQVGIGAPAAALFHLIGHGCYKASLFLGAGSGVNALRRERNNPGPVASDAPAIGRLAFAIGAPALTITILALTVTPPLHGIGTVILYAAALVTASVLLFGLLDPVGGLTRGRQTMAVGVVLGLLVTYLVGLYAFESAVMPVIGATSSPLPTPMLAALVVTLLLMGAVGFELDRRARQGRAPQLVVRAVQVAVTPRRRRRRTVAAADQQLITPVERARARAGVEAASEIAAPAWPLGQFVASNPLAGLEHLHFDEAVARAAQLRGSRRGLSHEHYVRLYASGRITDDALLDAVLTGLDGVPMPPPLPRTSLITLTRDLLVTSPQGVPGELQDAARTAAESLADRLSTLLNEAAVATTLARRVDTALGTEIDDQVADWVAAWCGYLLADTDVRWRTPGATLYARWRMLASAPGTDAAVRLGGFSEAVRQLPTRADEAVAAALVEMEIPEAQWRDYLTATLARLPGWASHVAWLEREERDGTATLIDLVAIELTVERLLVGAEARRAWQAPGTLPVVEANSHGSNTDLVDRASVTVEQVARAGGLDAESLSSMDDASLIRLLRFGLAIGERSTELWRAAHEASFRDPLVAELAGWAGIRNLERHEAPDVQAVFCIDVRSEPLRRQLEAAGRVDTLGFAGFFALPFSYRGLDAADATAQCPVLLQPRHDVREVVDPQHHAQAVRALRGARAVASAASAAAQAQKAPNAPFSFAEAAGWLFAPVALLRTAAPRSWHRSRALARRAMRPDVRTRQTIDETMDGLGFTSDEQLFLAEAVLRTMGLTDDFARLVMITGHGSHTENNPFEAAYDCGACGGNPGQANARALAAMLNNPRVRARLDEVDIRIPETTWFVPAQHDTTDDTVTLLDVEQVPASHWRDVVRLRELLAVATSEASLRRIETLPDAPGAASGASARRHVERRAADWAQTRPEWGLAGNAAFVVADRGLTERCDLDGRVFLHSYRWQDDADGAALEVILTAPMVVAEWISTQYYFSSIDPDHFGSGSKVLHNMVGRVGVLSGPRGDLKPGLPLQAVAEGVDAEGVHLRHEPLRLLTVVQAPVERVATIIDRNPVLQRLFGGGWVSLAVLDPTDGSTLRYTLDGAWRPWFGETSSTEDAEDGPVVDLASVRTVSTGAAR